MITHEEKGVVRVDIRKRDKLFSPEDLRDALLSVLDSNPAKVILDFSGIEKIDSSELKLFTLFAQDIRKSNSQTPLILEHLDIGLMKVVILTGLDSIFDIRL